MASVAIVVAAGPASAQSSYFGEPPVTVGGTIIENSEGTLDPAPAASSSSSAAATETPTAVASETAAAGSTGLAFSGGNAIVLTTLALVAIGAGALVLFTRRARTATIA